MKEFNIPDFESGSMLIKDMFPARSMISNIVEIQTGDGEVFSLLKKIEVKDKMTGEWIEYPSVGVFNTQKPLPAGRRLFCFVFYGGDIFINLSSVGSSIDEKLLQNAKEAGILVKEY